MIEDENSVGEPKHRLQPVDQKMLPLEQWYQPLSPSPVQTWGVAPPNLSPSKREVRVLFRELSTRIPSTTYGTFGLYRYPAKFIPQVIAYVLEHYGRSGMTVFDPFAGSGTAGLVARIYGLNYELWDLNPMLEVLHSVAVMKPVSLDVDEVIQKMSTCGKMFTPQWSNLSYWFPQEIIPFLCRVWGFYYSLDEPCRKLLMLVPLLKVTRSFSYNDPQRQKLSRSPVANRRVESLLNGDWKFKFMKMVSDEIRTVVRKLQEYQNLMIDNGDSIRAIVRGGVDAISASSQISDCEWDLLITSPPYLQAQEYIRCSKMDLFWLGYSEEDIRNLAKKEFPYREVYPIPIYSETYLQYHETIEEPALLKMFERYFYGVLGTLTNLAHRVSSHLFLFVGPATIRARPIPIDRIFVEHFTALGWKHEATLVDSIVARVMFRSRANPATGLKDERMSTEHLVILRR